MTSIFDRQTNCYTQPERSLLISLLLCVTDPTCPGLPLAAWDAGWAPYGEYGELRQANFRAAFGLVNVHIEPFDFVVTTVPTWFQEWAGSIAVGASDPSASCPCLAF